MSRFEHIEVSAPWKWGQALENLPLEPLIRPIARFSSLCRSLGMAGPAFETFLWGVALLFEKTMMGMW